jgi:hypothetical protein
LFKDTAILENKFEFVKQFLLISSARVDQMPNQFGDFIESAAPDPANFKAQGVMSA